MLTRLEYEVVREHRRDLRREAEKDRLASLVKRTIKRLENDCPEPGAAPDNGTPSAGLNHES